MEKIFHCALFMLVTSTVTFAQTPREIYDKYEFQYENECNKEIRLDLKKGAPLSTGGVQPTDGTMSQVPITNQDTSPLCYAYAGTYCIDAWRAKYDPPLPPRSSPMAGAIDFLNKRKVDHAGKAYALEHYLQDASRLELCEYSIVNDSIHSGGHVGFFDDMNRVFQALRSNQVNSEIQSLYKSCILKFPSSQLPDFASISKYATKSNWLDFTDAVLKDVCSGHKRTVSAIPQPVVVAAYKARDGVAGMYNIRNVINERLKQPSPMPVGIAFCPAVLIKKEQPTLTSSGKLDMTKCLNEHGQVMDTHFGAIVGKRPATIQTKEGPAQICQYLVRNTKGTDCSKFPNDKETKPSDRCIKGQIWVNEDELLTNTSDAMYLPDKGS